MNTLNYKALLIKTVFIVFSRAVGIYLLLTLPALLVPVMYEMSAVYALSFGWIAAFLFLGFFYFLQKIVTGVRTKQNFLYGAVVVAVVAAFQMMEVMGVQYQIWRSGLFLLFPAAAIVSGWISIAVSVRVIKILFAGDAINHTASVANTTSTVENILKHKSL